MSPPIFIVDIVQDLRNKRWAYRIKDAYGNIVYQGQPRYFTAQGALKNGNKRLSKYYAH
jgi:hypothetical protein